MDTIYEDRPLPSAKTLARICRRRRWRFRALLLSVVVLAIVLGTRSAAWAWITEHALAWIVISCVIVLLTLYRYLAVLGRLRIDLDDEVRTQLLEEALAKVGGDVLGVNIYVSEHRLGVLHGRRVLVAKRVIDSLTPEELSAVVAHELGHWSDRYRLSLHLLAAPCVVLMAVGGIAPFAPDVAPYWIAALAVFLAFVARLIYWRTDAEAQASEHLADLAAAERVGTSSTISMLWKLHHLVNRERAERGPRSRRQQLRDAARSQMHPNTMDRVRFLRQETRQPGRCDGVELHPWLGLMAPPG